MTTTADFRELIAAQIEAIPNIGKVNKYERYAKQTSQQREFFATDGRLLGWIIKRARFKKTELSTGLTSVRNTWEVRGYMALDDDAQTELIFDALADIVQLKLSMNPTFGIGESVENYEIKGDIGHVMFAGVLSHNVTITFDTVHIETATIDEAMGDFLSLHAQYDIPPFETSAEHEKWNQDTPDHSTSKPELTAVINPQEQE